MQGNRVMWLCKVCFKAMVWVGGRPCKICFNTGIGIKNVIQDNRVMWLCNACFKGRIGIGGYAKYFSRLG